MNDDDQRQKVLATSLSRETILSPPQALHIIQLCEDVFEREADLEMIKKLIEAALHEGYGDVTTRVCGNLQALAGALDKSTTLPVVGDGSIYVASSWRNTLQPDIVAILRQAGHKVYDFRHPVPGDNGFHWEDIDPKWRDWSVMQLCAALRHPLARDGYSKDMGALTDCSACVMVLPCGKSAHLEAGWCVGAGKPTAIYSEEETEPELMYAMAGIILDNRHDLLMWARTTLPKTEED